LASQFGATVTVTDGSARRRRVAVAVLSAILGIALAWFTRWRIEESQRPAPETAEVALPDGSGSGDEVIAVGRALVRRFGGYSSWPACHRRLGIY
jgi:hypothetical protein